MACRSRRCSSGGVHDALQRRARAHAGRAHQRACSQRAEHEQLPLSNLLSDPAIVVEASELLLRAGAALFGDCRCRCSESLSCWPSGGLSSVGDVPPTIAILTGILLVGEIALASLMIVRHPPVYEHCRPSNLYYPLPFQAMILDPGRVISRLGAGWSRGQATVAVAVLAAIVVSNVAHWGDYRRAQLRPRWFPVVYAQTTALRESLADGRPRPALSPEDTPPSTRCVSGYRQRCASAPRVPRASP